MGELVDRDLEHLTMLKLGFYIMAGIHGFYFLCSLLYIAMAGLIAFGVTPTTGSPINPRFVASIVLGFGLAFLLFGLAAGSLTYFAGRSLGERRRRIFCMVVAGLMCLSIPFGTALGVCAIIVLNRPSVKDLFDGQSVPPAIPSPPSRSA